MITHVLQRVRETRHLQQVIAVVAAKGGLQERGEDRKTST